MRRDAMAVVTVMMIHFGRFRRRERVMSDTTRHEML